VYERIELKDNVKSSRAAKQSAKCLYYNREVDYVYVNLGSTIGTVTKHWYILRNIAARRSIPRIVLYQYPLNSPSVAIIERSPEIFLVQTYQGLVITSSAMRHFDRSSFFDLPKRLDRSAWPNIRIEYVSFSHLEVGMIGDAEGVSKRKRAWEELVVSLLDFGHPFRMNDCLNCV
jgi:hypothetical protein